MPRKPKDLSKLLEMQLQKFAPGKVKDRRGKRKETCNECKVPLILSKTRRGRGYCELCGMSYAIPIGTVSNPGPHYGKLVYCKRSIMDDLMEETGSFEDAKIELERELRRKDYFIVDLED